MYIPNHTDPSREGRSLKAPDVLAQSLPKALADH